MNRHKIAGTMALFAAVGHGYLGDQTIRGYDIEPESAKNLLRAAYQFGSAGWVAGAVLLFCSDKFDDTTRTWLVRSLVPLYGFGAIVNLWFKKGLHPGWILLGAVCVLIVLGARHPNDDADVVDDRLLGSGQH